MQTTLVGTVLLLGFFGGPHCIAMCSAACAGVIQIARAPRGGGVAVLPARTVGLTTAFHLGRLAAYAAGGAVAALAFQSLGWASDQVVVLRPVWVMLHAFVLIWALLLLVMGRQPVWVDRAGRLLSARIQPWVGSPLGLLASGALWILMPCTLLYSALMVAGLSSGPAEGAGLMLLFGLASGLWLVLAPWLWTQLRERTNGLRKDWGTRLAGLLLALVAGQAIWMDLRHQIELWCQ